MLKYPESTKVKQALEIICNVTEISNLEICKLEKFNIEKFNIEICNVLESNVLEICNPTD
jgi:hypothetical protein